MASPPDSPREKPDDAWPFGGHPRGVELVLKIASFDPVFRDLLLHQRGGAAEMFGIPLTEAEAATLRAAPREQLESIIAQTVVPEEQRPDFLYQTVQMLMYMGSTGAWRLVRQQTSRGITPDRPVRRRDAPESGDDLAEPMTPDLHVGGGVRPDRPDRPSSKE